MNYQEFGFALNTRVAGTSLEIIKKEIKNPGFATLAQKREAV
jgi:hypothetical protein